MQIYQIPFTQTGYFNSLMVDYIQGNSELTPYYSRASILNNAKEQFEEKQRLEVDRNILVNALKEQYTRLNSLNHSDNLTQQLERLKSPNCYTVTTGHQLCLFTGPLYFIYKIANTINMAKQLSAKYPDQDFVPVFWMASEDHDFEEINHIHYNGHKIAWHREIGGGVGRMEVDSCAKALEALEFQLPQGKRAAYLKELFSKAYAHANLADATRYIVNELFGAYGVVIVDGDDAALKSLVAPYFKRELLEGVGEEYVSESAEHLKNQGYKVQVNPRDVNLFYLLDDYRERLTRTEEGFETSDGSYSFSKNEILKELEDHPERFSPNVVLRPLYQEVILPNIAYIGGGGELAYWLELKAMFDAFKVPFPMLRLRNSVGVIPKAISRKIDKLDFEIEELFKPYHELSAIFVKRNCDMDEHFEQIRESLNRSIERFDGYTESLSQDLSGAIEATKKRIQNNILNLEKKVLRNAKREQSDELRMLQEVKNELFPGGGLQERKDNFCKMYLAYGDDFIPQVLKSTSPFANEFTIMREE